MSDWIDITRPIGDELMLWPGRKPPRVTWEKRISEGHHCNVSSWEISAHCGTHLDAPLHFIEGGISVDQISPEVLIGDCRVVRAPSHGREPLGPDAIGDYLGAQRGLIRTAHSDPTQENRYQDHAALLTPEAANVLLEHGMRLLGTDRLSVDDSNGRGYEIHQLLLGAGCVILEGLNLHSVKEGDYRICALPLRLVGAEASPARVLLFSSGC